MQNKLASLRRYKNISQREMGEMIGVSTETYSNKERGKRDFKSTEMFIISDFFGMRIDEIFLNTNFINHEVNKSEVMK